MPPKKSTRKRSASASSAVSTPNPTPPQSLAQSKSGSGWPLALVIFGLLLFIVAIALSKNKPATSTNQNANQAAESLNNNTNAVANLNLSPALTNTTEPAEETNTNTNTNAAVTVQTLAEPKTLIENVSAPAVWFPDQQRFVYTTDPDGANINDPYHKVNLNIYEINTGESTEVPSVSMMAMDVPTLITMFNDGSGFGIVSWEEEVVIVTPDAETSTIKTPGKVKTSGDFSSDGKWFVYTTTDGEVFKLDVSAEKISSLGTQTYPMPTATDTVNAPSYLAPSFSPDNQWIVFERRFPPAERTVYSSDPEVAVSLLPATAASIDAMTVIGKSYIIETEGYTTFDWSSDSRYVSHSWSGSVFDTKTKSVLLQAEGRFDDDAVRILTSQFAPSGLRLLQAVNQRSTAQLQYLNLPSTTANVTPAGNTNWRQFPIWDPDGSVIYNINAAGNPNLIERIDLVDRSTKTLAKSGDKISNLVISPDGSTLLFSAQTKGDAEPNKNEIRSLPL